jgi:ankyrin repeat protein
LASTRDDAGVSVVCLAVYHGHDAIAQLLRSRRTNLDIFEASALGDASRIGETARAPCRAVECVLAGRLPPARAGLLLRPAGRVRHPARAWRGHRGPSRNAMQVRAIHSAAAHRDPVVALDLVRRLLAAGAAVNVRQQGGYTPLHEAAQRGHVDMVRLLLEHHPDVTCRTDDGKTALDLARAAGHDDIVALLAS